MRFVLVVAACVNARFTLRDVKYATKNFSRKIKLIIIDKIELGKTKFVHYRQIKNQFTIIAVQCDLKIALL